MPLSPVIQRRRSRGDIHWAPEYLVTQSTSAPHFFNCSRKRANSSFVTRRSVTGFLRNASGQSWERVGHARTVVVIAVESHGRHGYKTESTAAFSKAFMAFVLVMELPTIYAGIDHRSRARRCPQWTWKRRLFGPCFDRIEDRVRLRGYSMTSSARGSRVGGMVMPSAFAVLRLITSSYLIGACTGRSAGLSPLSTRSTTRSESVLVYRGHSHRRSNRRRRQSAREIDRWQFVADRKCQDQIAMH